MPSVVCALLVLPNLLMYKVYISRYHFRCVDLTERDVEDLGK
jgi:hypothetical protein